MYVLPGAAPVLAQSSPEVLLPGLSVRYVADAEGSAVRLAYDASEGVLYYAGMGGDVYRLSPPFGGAPAERVYTSADHGLASMVLGLAIAGDGTMYLVGNDVDGAFNTGVVVRGRPGEGGVRVWETVARSEPYPRSNTPFDHNFNEIAVGPQGRYLYLNSGSRTDHGEVQDNDGLFPGLREVPLTSAILRIPADASGLVLQNDEAFLRENGYLFADGTRNSFSLAFDANGSLFGTENSGDRDDSEELNLLEEGRHYGFPWRMGLAETPMQFPGYDPAEDPRLNPASTAVQSGFFYNDPAYPPPPEGTVFTDPIRNLGPDADRYRDAVDGVVRDASEEGTPLATFTSHRSPLGLVFDTSAALPGDYAGDGFVLSWTGTESPLLRPLGDEGEDLLHLDLQPEGDTYAVRVERMVKGFLNPIDAVLLGNELYVLEFGGGARIWAVTFAVPEGVEDERPAPAFAVDLYPNPASDAVSLVVRPDRPRRVEIDVYSLLGKRVRHLHAGVLSGGSHAFKLPVAGLAAGTYLLRIRGTGTTLVRAFVVLP